MKNDKDNILWNCSTPFPENDRHDILWDCHMHSSFSADSDAPMEEMVQRAKALGLSGVCFTEHVDIDYPETPDGLVFLADIPACYAEILRLRGKYPDFQILFGVEAGLQPHLKDEIHRLTREYPFDFVIGSSHIVHRRDPYYPEYFQGRTAAEGYREYFESILENLGIFDEIDTYGHLDYVVRYGPGKNRDYSYSRFADVLDAILVLLVKKNIGLEVNTGGYAAGLGAPNPSGEIIRRYRELGGEIVTIGADAHAPERIAYSFDRAAGLLRDCGFRYYAVFQERKPVFFSL